MLVVFSSFVHNPTAWKSAISNVALHVAPAERLGPIRVEQVNLFINISLSVRADGVHRLEGYGGIIFGSCNPVGC
jgi:hypothetical protein